MYLLFIPAALGLLFAFAISMQHLFEFKPKKTMLEQIEEEMRNRRNRPPEHFNCRCLPIQPIGEEA